MALIPFLEHSVTQLVFRQALSQLLDRDAERIVGSDFRMRFLKRVRKLKFTQAVSQPVKQ